jgi:hypothetical protein
MLPPCPLMLGELVASLPKRVSRPALRLHFRKQPRIGRVCIPRQQQRGKVANVEQRLDGREQGKLHYQPPKVINTINMDQHGDQHRLSGEQSGSTPSTPLFHYR